MKNVLVTGGGGFIGKAITKALHQQGVSVSVLGRNRYPDLVGIGVECIQGDIQNLDDCHRAVQGKDTVFHVAALAEIWGPWEMFHGINVVGTDNIITACIGAGVENMVHTSTPSVVFDSKSIEGGDESLPYAEKPLCHYAKSKIMAEKRVLKAAGDSLRTVAIRPHLVWGPGDTNLIPRLIDRGRNGSLKRVGSGTNQVDIAFIDNVVHAHLIAAENLKGSGTASGKAFFIGQDQPVFLWDWINGLFVRLGIPEVAKSVPTSLAYGAGFVMEVASAILLKKEEPKMTRFLAQQLSHSHWFSHTLAEKTLGYRQQVDTETGLNRLVAWLTEEKKSLR